MHISDPGFEPPDRMVLPKDEVCVWRIETYTGVKMKEIGFLEFWEFMWRERRELWRFLRWTGEMERWVHPKPKNS